MKVVRIIARLNVGGPARHVVWLTEALNNDEFSSVLIAGTVPDGEEDMGYLAEQAGIEPVLIKEMSRELSPKDAAALVKIFRRLRAERPDVVHTHTAKAGTVGRVAAFLYRWMTWSVLIGRPRNVRIVHTFHGHVFHSYYGRGKTSFFLLIERLLARVTDRIIVISDQQFKEISGEFKVGDPRRFSVIPLGIELPGERDDEKRQAFRNEFGLSDNDIAVGFVGRLTEIKNIPCFIAAAAIAQKDVDSPCRFIIVGDGHLRSELENIAARLGVGDAIKFAGSRTDMNAVYAGLDVVALTSNNEGTPLSLIEAMAAGLPVISTAVGGVVDLLGPAVETDERFTICQRGIAVEPDAADGLYAGIKLLANDEAVRKRLAAAGRRFVHDKYGKARLINDIKSLYRNLFK